MMVPLRVHNVMGEPEKRLRASQDDQELIPMNTTQKRNLLLAPAALAALGLALTGCVTVDDRGQAAGPAESTSQSAGQDGVEIDGDNDQSVTVGGDTDSPDTPTVQVPDTDTDATETPEPAETADAPETTDAPANGGAAGLNALPLEAGWTPNVSTKMTCTGGEATISAAEATVLLTSYCDKVTLQSADTLLLAPEGIGELTVTGADNDVAVTRLDSLRLTGSDNTIAYTGTKPSISNIGADNEVSTRPLDD